MLTQSKPNAAAQRSGEVRHAASRVRAELALGHITLGQAIADSRAGVIETLNLLTYQPGWGRRRAQYLLAQLEIRENKRIRELTDRQRRLITEAAAR